MDEKLKEIIPVLEKYQQMHLIDFYDELDEKEKEELINQIKKIDFNFLNKLYINSFKNDVIDYKTIAPIDYYSKYDIQEKEKYVQIGEEILKNNKLAVITLAGGMGSRLGFKGPKGTYELQLPPDEKHKSLFEFICDKLKEANQKYNCCIPWYIMTSPSNDERTKKYFELHNYFGYPQDKIIFFKQYTIHILDINGKIMLDNIGKLKRDSNGNGDIFNAFKKAKQEETLKDIDWISVSGIDNILLDIVDPLFIGLTAFNKSSIASKSVAKRDLDSKTWVFAKIKDRVEIVNPVYLTEKMKKEKDENGKYKYNQINILAHLFSKEAFLKCAELDIPYHRAFKKTDYINEEGMKMVVQEPNSFKFEKFIFDVFKYFDNFTLLEVDESLEFAPIKAFTGMATPERALEMYVRKMKRGN